MPAGLRLRLPAATAPHTSMATDGVSREPAPACAGGAGAAEPRRSVGAGAAAVLNTAGTKVSAIEGRLG
eukprot:3464411-Heterocapsa_arctica.AAC.1